MKQKHFILMMVLCMTLSLAACTGNKDNLESTAESSAFQSEIMGEETSSTVAEERESSDSELDLESDSETNSEIDFETENEKNDDNNVNSNTETSHEEEFTPMEVQENGEIKLDEEQGFVIH